MKYIHVMTIAGSDCSGGAGIQADIKTISALGGYASSVITGVTVQNTRGVTAVHPVPAEIVGGQIRAVVEDARPDVIKIGMVTDSRIIETIVKELSNPILQEAATPIVFDPVLVSSSGFPLVDEGALSLIREKLLPLCYLITPNIPETEVLTDMTLEDDRNLPQAASRIWEMGCPRVLIKGGHRTNGDMMDYLAVAGDPQAPYSFSQEQIHTRNTHGTGCTLASAIATFLAKGCTPQDAIGQAKAYLTQAMLAGADVSFGQGNGPLNHFFAPRKAILR